MQCNQLIEIILPILSSTEKNQIALPEITGWVEHNNNQKSKYNGMPILQLVNNLYLFLLCSMYGKIPIYLEYLEFQWPEFLVKFI